jgi:hypothetical protein
MNMSGFAKTNQIEPFVEIFFDNLFHFFLGNTFLKTTIINCNFQNKTKNGNRSKTASSIIKTQFDGVLNTRHCFLTMVKLHYGEFWLKKFRSTVGSNGTWSQSYQTWQN